MSSLSNDTNCSSNNSPRNISTEQEAVFRQYYYHFIASVVVGGLICSFALASNIICLIAICTSRKLRHRGTVLVANLVVVCILLSLTVYPISTVTTLYVQYCLYPAIFVTGPSTITLLFTHSSGMNVYCLLIDSLPLSCPIVIAQFPVEIV